MRDNKEIQLYDRIYREYKNGKTIPQLAKDYYTGTTQDQDFINAIIEERQGVELERTIAHEVNVMKISANEVAAAHRVSVAEVERCVKAHPKGDVKRVPKEKMFIDEIVKLRKQGKTYKEIVDTLQTPNIKLSQAEVGNWLTKYYKRTGETPVPNVKRPVVKKQVKSAPAKKKEEAPKEEEKKSEFPYMVENYEAKPKAN